MKNDEPTILSKKNEIDLVWDKEAALKRLMGNTDLLKRICGIFVEKSPAQMALLSQHITDQNFELIGKQSHSLKGSSGDLGATELHAYFAEIEIQAKQRNVEGVTESFEKVKVSYASFKDMLDKFLE